MGKVNTHMIAQIRRLMGYNQTEVAKLLNRSTTWLSQVELRKRIPTKQQAIEITRILSCPYEEIFGEEEER